MDPQFDCMCCLFLVLYRLCLLVGIGSVPLYMQKVMMVVGSDFNISEVEEMIETLPFRAICWTVEVVEAVLCPITTLHTYLLIHYKQ